MYLAIQLIETAICFSLYEKAKNRSSVLLFIQTETCTCMTNHNSWFSVMISYINSSLTHLISSTLKKQPVSLMCVQDYAALQLDWLPFQ
jgi:hypothetical protein